MTDAPDLVHVTARWRVLAVPLIPGARLHFKLEPINQVADLDHLSLLEKADFWVALAWVKDSYELTYYVFMSRNGDSRYTGGDDDHACVYLVVGDPDSDTIVKHQVSSGAGRD